MCYGFHPRLLHNGGAVPRLSLPVKPCGEVKDFPSETERRDHNKSNEEKKKDRPVDDRMQVIQSISYFSLYGAISLNK